jgi:hypothetical protein
MLCFAEHYIHVDAKVVPLGTKKEVSALADTQSYWAKIHTGTQNPKTKAQEKAL